MLSFQQILSSREKDLRWRDFLEGEEGRLFHEKCQSCNFFCDNRVLRYRKFDKDQCRKKQERKKKNEEDEIFNGLLERIEGKLSGSPKKSIK
ncbi:hypothetical protein KAK05_03770 [Candidatus Parcubacteria bacterium]|nr:hypothetical protein [Candidatus Parcubacteria bacterium]